MDFGEDALLETIARLNSEGFSVFGAGDTRQAASKPYRFRARIDGREKRVFVFTGFEVGRRYEREYNYYATKSSAGVSALSLRRLVRQIERTRTRHPDALIVCCPHWYVNYEWVGLEARELSANLIAAGADVVIGSGTHMLGQCLWSEAGTQILSLGNFVFNSVVSYDAYSAPPFSLVARLTMGLEDDRWSSSLKLYPLVTDNVRTDFRPHAINSAALSRVYTLLADTAPNEADFREHFEPDEDERGPHINLRRAISTRFAAAASL